MKHRKETDKECAPVSSMESFLEKALCLSSIKSRRKRVGGDSAGRTSKPTFGGSIPPGGTKRKLLLLYLHSLSMLITERNRYVRYRGRLVEREEGGIDAEDEKYMSGVWSLFH